jgi:uncharacterized damage-inducible protein DinB
MLTMLPQERSTALRLERSLLMTESILTRIFEHNNWANLGIIRACSRFVDEQLDAAPKSATKGSIRRTLLHLVDSQQYYLSLLTGVEPSFHWDATAPFDELEQAATITGEQPLELARDETGKLPKTPIRTDDGYLNEPWVIMVQAINHATEHREQICSMFSALGVTPQDLDGWSYGEASKAVRPAPA